MMTNQDFIEKQKSLDTGPLFPRFVAFLSIELIIPSVMAVSKVSPERHGALITWAVGIVAAFYLILGGLKQYESLTYVEIPKWARKVIALPSLFASIHIGMGAIVDVVIAWRYGLNVKVAELHYPKRVKAVRVLLPFALYAFCFFFSFFYGSPLKEKPLFWVAGSLITFSMVLFIIPYCYKATEELFASRDVEDGQKWWVYVVFAGGVAYVAATLYFIINNQDFNILASLTIDACIMGVFVLWQLIGQFFK
jgi:hypothetical protein